MQITVCENFLSNTEIDSAHEEILNVPCKWAKKKHTPKWRFWTGIIQDAGDSFADSEMKKKYPNVVSIFQKACDSLSLTNKIIPITTYVNSSTIADDGIIHQDNGDITLLYYSNPSWLIEWDGGTCFYNNQKTDYECVVSYRPGRIVAFDSKIFHKSCSISLTEEVRTVLVYKCVNTAR